MPHDAAESALPSGSNIIPQSLVQRLLPPYIVRRKDMPRLILREQMTKMAAMMTLHPLLSPWKSGGRKWRKERAYCVRGSTTPAQIDTNIKATMCAATSWTEIVGRCTEAGKSIHACIKPLGVATRPHHLILIHLPQHDVSTVIQVLCLHFILRVIRNRQVDIPLDVGADSMTEEGSGIRRAHALILSRGRGRHPTRDPLDVRRVEGIPRVSVTGQDIAEGVTMLRTSSDIKRKHVVSLLGA
jgi:hypothetical protein